MPRPADAPADYKSSCIFHTDRHLDRAREGARLGGLRRALKAAETREKFNPESRTGRWALIRRSIAMVLANEIGCVARARVLLAAVDTSVKLLQDAERDLELERLKQEVTQLVQRRERGVLG